MIHNPQQLVKELFALKIIGIVVLEFVLYCDQSWGQASVKPREASVENSSPSSLYVILRNDTMFVFFTMLIG